MDLRPRLGLGPAESGPAARIVVVRSEGSEEPRTAGLLVDSVREVLHVAEAEIRPAAGADSQGIVCGLCTRGDDFVSILDLDRVMEVHGDA